jgi:hypothetical protein
MRPGQFVSTVPFDSSHPSALAIYCSDGRFTEAVEELLRQGAHPRLDTLTLPGGPALFHAWRASFGERDVIVRAAAFLITGHRVREVFLLAHEGCGYYRTNNPGRGPDELYARQIEDLRVASRALRAEHPHVEVRSYYARPGQGRVTFESVAG